MSGSWRWNNSRVGGRHPEFSKQPRCIFEILPHWRSSAHFSDARQFGCPIAGAASASHRPTGVATDVLTHLPALRLRREHPPSAAPNAALSRLRQPTRFSLRRNEMTPPIALAVRVSVCYEQTRAPSGCGRLRGPSPVACSQGLAAPPATVERPGGRDAGERSCELQ